MLIAFKKQPEYIQGIKSNRMFIDAEPADFHVQNGILYDNTFSLSWREKKCVGVSHFIRGKCIFKGNGVINVLVVCIVGSLVKDG